MSAEKIGRNDPCPCGSGKKYKQCCQRLQATLPARRGPDPVAIAASQALQVGIEHHQAGRLPQAEALYRQILETAPEHADALHYSGLIAFQSGASQTAIELIGRALAINPEDAFAHCNMGNALLELKRPDDALICFDHALRLKPDFTEACYNRGGALLDLERYDEAVDCNDRVIQLKPDLAAAHINKGKALLELERYEEALVCNQRALQLRPGDALTHNNLGKVLQAMERFDEAITSYRNALSCCPGDAEAHNHLGSVFHCKGEFDAAIDSYRTALAWKPDFAEAYNNLGLALQHQGKLADAMSCYRSALSHKPDYVKAHCNLGSIFQAQGELDAAIDSYRKALALRADFAEAYSNLGFALQAQGKLDEALDCARQALRIKPDYVEAHSNLLFGLNYHPELSAEAIFAEYRRWNEQHARPLRQNRPYANQRDPMSKVRIGYVSPDLRRHSARHFIEPLLARHDKTRFEVFAYAQVPIEDDVSARFKTYVDRWRNTCGISDAEMDAQIRSDGIDILVDLAGHTYGNRLLVFARKPAPIQVSWLGYGYTTGLDAIDYLLADREFAPPGNDPLFSEKLVRLPRWTAYRPQEDIGETTPLPAQKTGSISFGSLSRTVRINHRVIRTWAAILQRVPGSRLIVNSGDLRSAGMRANIRERFAECGITAERLELGYQSPPWDVLGKIDIGLDCFPHNSGTTLFENLYLGIPFITLADRPSVGRIGATILTAVGHPEWIAASEQEYIEKAMALAADIGKLAVLRAGLRSEMAASSLMDEKALACSIEEAYLTMWRRWCEGLEVSEIECE